MSWSLKGSYVETCSCELMCPCNLSFDHGATYDYCRVTLVFNIRKARSKAPISAAGKVAMIADTPKVMTEGNWKLGVFVDDGASDEQFDKLVKVFSGELGGPMGALAPLVGEISGVERAAIEIGDDGLSTGSRSATRSTSRSRTSSRSASRPASRSGSTACSTRSART